MKPRADIEARKATLIAVSASQRRELGSLAGSISGRFTGVTGGLSLTWRLTRQPVAKLGLGALLLLAPRRWVWRLLQGAALARLLARRRRW